MQRDKFAAEVAETVEEIVRWSERNTHEITLEKVSVACAISMGVKEYRRDAGE